MKRSPRLIPTIFIGIVMFAALSMACSCLSSLFLNYKSSEFGSLVANAYLPAILTGAAMGATPGLGWRTLSAFVCSLVFLLNWSFPQVVYAVPASLLAAGTAYFVERAIRDMESVTGRSAG